MPNVFISIFKLALSLSLVTSNASAEAIKSESELPQISELFMNKLFAGDTKAAYDELSKYVSGAPEEFTGASMKAIGMMTEAKSRLGEPLKYDLVRSEKIGDYFRRHNYLLLFPTTALVWEITYYRAGKDWNVVGVNYGARLDYLFEPM